MNKIFIFILIISTTLFGAEKAITISEPCVCLKKKIYTATANNTCAQFCADKNDAEPVLYGEVSQGNLEAFCTTPTNNHCILLFQPFGQDSDYQAIDFAPEGNNFQVPVKSLKKKQLFMYSVKEIATGSSSNHKFLRLR